MQNSEDIRLGIVKKSILDAFQDVEMPSTEILQAYDDHEQEIADAFGRRHWSEVDVFHPTIQRGLTLILLQPEWFHFYLPAYMNAILQAKDDKKFAYYFLEELTPPKGPPNSIDIFDSRMQLLTVEQREAVASFVRFVLERDFDDLSLPERLSGLPGYWLQEGETEGEDDPKFQHGP